jgi:hypothetical protein
VEAKSLGNMDKVRDMSLEKLLSLKDRYRPYKKRTVLSKEELLLRIDNLSLSNHLPKRISPLNSQIFRLQ